MPRMVHGTQVALTSDGGFLIDARHEFCFHLNEVGVIVWRQLQAGADQSTIVAELRRQFPDTDPGVLSTDAEAFIADLATAGLLI